MNKTIINGYLGKEPEVKVTPNGKKVCSFGLAVDDGKDANGEKKTQWIDCVAWEQRAEFLERYIHKGDKILVEGKLTSRQYERNGEQRKVTEVLCDRLEIERSKEANVGQGNYHPQQNRSQKAQNEPRDGGEKWGKPLDIDESDLPF